MYGRINHWHAQHGFPWETTAVDSDSLPLIRRRGAVVSFQTKYALAGFSKNARQSVK